MVRTRLARTKLGLTKFVMQKSLKLRWMFTASSTTIPKEIVLKEINMLICLQMRITALEFQLYNLKLHKSKQFLSVLVSGEVFNPPERTNFIWSSKYSLDIQDIILLVWNLCHFWISWYGNFNEFQTKFFQVWADSRNGTTSHHKFLLHMV